jgi:hypothetical protein
MKDDNSAAPSAIAASTTCPFPDVRASNNPARTPTASIIPPPPKSPTVLSPTGHATVDELWISRETRIRAKAKSLHRSRPESFDQCVGARNEVERDRDILSSFEIQRDRRSSAREHVVARIVRHNTRRHSHCAVDPHHVGAEVGEHHAAKGRGADADHFNNSRSVERTSHRRGAPRSHYRGEGVHTRYAPPSCINAMRYHSPS